MHARKAVRSAFVAVLSLSMLVLASTSAAAADGDLDPTFDGDGRVVTDFGGNDGLGGVAIQADGKTVVAGATELEGRLDFSLARYTAAGALDPTFGGDGKVSTDFGARDGAFAVAIQPDGKIVAAGSNGPATGGGNTNFALARYNPDGSLDPTFGGDGMVITDVGRYGYAADLAIQADGKIVATGSIGDPFAPPYSFDFALARYNADGSLDTTFDGDGKVSTDLGAWDLANSVAVQADGKIVAAGSAGTGGNPPLAYDFALARYNRDGSLDSTFDGDGKVLTDFGGFDRAFSIAIQSGARIVAAGSANSDFALARYKPDGSLDQSFDGDGRLKTDFGGGTDSALGVAIQADDKIVAAGYRSLGDAVTFALARYLDGGTLDPTFGNNGKVLTAFDAVAFGDDVAIAPDGKIVVAGDRDDPDQSDFALARYVSQAPVNHPPNCSTVAPSPTTLRPPNHRFRLVTLGGAVDADGDPVTLAIRAVTQDEPVRARETGNTAPDAARAARSNDVLLRAERSGVGDGRVYRVWFTANDGKGGSCWGVVKVGVPRGARSAIDSAPPSFNSFGP